MYLKRYIFLQQPCNDRRVTGDGSSLYCRHRADGGRNGFTQAAPQKTAPAQDSGMSGAGDGLQYFLISNNYYQ